MIRETAELESFARGKVSSTSTIESLEKELAELKAAHKKTELDLRKRKVKIEAEVDNWITKYDHVCLCH